MVVKYIFLLIIRCFIKFAFIASFLFGLSLTANAFQLSPVIATLEPTGIKSEQIYLLTNTTSKPAAVQFSVTTRQQRRDGSEIRDPAKQLFNVHPAQVVIPAGGTQKVRLKWLGKKPVIRELAYRFIAKQLPIKLSKEKGISINMVMTIEAAVYIKPAGMAIAPPSRPTKRAAQQQVNRSYSKTTPAMLKVAGVRVVNTPKGKQLALTIQNPSREHIVLNNMQVLLTANGQKILLRGRQLGNMQKQNLLAGSIRNFMMPIPARFNQKLSWTAQVQKIR